MPGKQPSYPPRLGSTTIAQEEAGIWVRLAVFHFFEMELHRHQRRNDRPCATEWVSYAISIAVELHKGPPARAALTMSEEVAALTAALGEVQLEASEHGDQELLEATKKARDDLRCAAAWL